MDVWCSFVRCGFRAIHAALSVAIWAIDMCSSLKVAEAGNIVRTLIINGLHAIVINTAIYCNPRIAHPRMAWPRAPRIQLQRELRGFSERFPAELRQELREVKCLRLNGEIHFTNYIIYIWYILLFNTYIYIQYIMCASGGMISAESSDDILWGY